MITLTEGKSCKCYCRHHTGSDGKDYWYNSRKGEVYSTDCHKNNPQLATGTFVVDGKTIIQ